MTHHDPRQCDLFAAAMLSPHQRLTVFDQAPSVANDDFANVVAQEIAKRALEIAAVADHSIQLVGDPDDARPLLRAAKALGLTQGYSSGTGSVRATDLNVYLQPVSDVDRRLPPPAECTAEIVHRVEAARPRLARWPREAVEGSLEPNAAKLLEDAMKAMHLTDADVARVWLVARSIAALADAPERLGRIHIAEALSYARPIEVPRAPEPPSPPAEQPARIRERETVAVDPKRLEHPNGDIGRSYSAQSLAEKGAVKSPFRFKGGEWVNTGGCWHGGKGRLECYRIVPLAAFDGPSAPYREHNWEMMRGNAEVGSYHGMSAKHGARDVVLQGPPILFVGGAADQSALL